MPLPQKTSLYARAYGYFGNTRRKNTPEINEIAYQTFTQFLNDLAPTGVPLEVSTKEFWDLIKLADPIVYVESTSQNKQTIPFYHWCTLFGVSDIEDLAEAALQNPHKLQKQYQHTWDNYLMAQKALQDKKPSLRTTEKTTNVTYLRLAEHPNKKIPHQTLVYIDYDLTLKILKCSPEVFEEARKHLQITLRTVASLGEEDEPLYFYGGIQALVALWGQGDANIHRALATMPPERLKDRDKRGAGRHYTHQQLAELFQIPQQTLRNARNRMKYQPPAVLILEKSFYKDLIPAADAQKIFDECLSENIL